MKLYLEFDDNSKSEEFGQNMKKLEKLTLKEALNIAIKVEAELPNGEKQVIKEHGMLVKRSN